MATVGADDTLHIWEMPEGREVLRTRPFKAMPHAVTFSPDGARLCVALANGTAVLVDAVTGEPIGRPMAHHFMPSYVGPGRYPRFDDSGARLMLQPKTNQVQVFEVSTQAPIGPLLKLSGPIERADFSRDGATLFTATSGGGQPVAWEIALGRDHPIPGAGPGVPRSVHFADRHDSALVGRSLWVWPEPTNRTVLALDSTWLRFAAFSPAADRVVAPVNEGAVRIFDTFTGEPIGTPLLHDREVATAVFSPDGTRILTVADDDTARLWDAFSGEPLTPPLPHLTDADLFGFNQFSPSGRFFITVHPGFLIATWDLHHEPEPPGLLKPQARQVVGTSYTLGDPYVSYRPGSSIRIRNLLLGDEVSLHPISLKSMRRNAWRDQTGRYMLLESDGARVQVWDSKSGLPLTPSVPSSYTADTNRTTALSLPTLDWPAEDLVAVAELLSGNHLDASGGWTPLTGEEVLDRWQRLRQKLPEIYRDRNRGVSGELPGAPSRSSLPAPRPDVASDWHSKEAAAAAEVLDWRAAVFHLERFAAEHPTNTAAAGDLSYARHCLDRLEALAGGPALGLGLTPPRDPRVDPRCVDLSQHYNSTLDATVHPGRERAAFHAGLQQLGDVRFDVRGVVALSGAGPRDGGIKRPEEVRNILVGRRCASIHLLHYADFATDTNGTAIAIVTVRYEDGTSVAVPLRLGIEVSSDLMSEPFEPEGAKLAWVGLSRQGSVARQVKRLCRYTWRNPNPERAVAALDLVSAKASAGYCLFGVTVD